MRIERVPLARIDPAPYNPRVSLAPGDPEYESLRKSLASFGCVEPLVWNQRTGRLVGGHQRLAVLRDLGEREVEVSVVDLPEHQEKALNLALNRIAGRWDEARLAEVLAELTELPDFDLGVTGFDDGEVAELLSRALDDGVDAGDDDFDVGQALDTAAAAPVTAPGDSVRLGPHLLVCGDCTDEAVMSAALPSGSAGLLFTDPPYNVDYEVGQRPTPQRVRRKDAVGPATAPRPAHARALRNDASEQGEYERMLFRAIALAAGRMRPGAAAYVWNGHRQFGPMHEAFERAGLRASTVITWAKERFALSYADYNPQTEFCLYGWKPSIARLAARAPETLAPGAAPGASAGGRCRGHEWHGPTNESTLWEVSRDAAREYAHPTQKPLELAERAMRNSTLRGATVLDPFLGSGTTLIAAERLGRRCVGVEIDPVWCDVIVRRYLALTQGRGVDPDVIERYSSPRGYEDDQ